LALQAFGSGSALAAFIVAVALIALGTLAQAGEGQAGQDEEAAHVVRRGGGFEFRRRLSSVDNPYCAITTNVVGEFPEQATSTVDGNGRAVIALDASILKSDRPYAHFLMAHECCHHTLGHVRLTSAQLGHLGPQPFYYIRPLLKNMELDADTCAARMLKLTKEPDAIDAARRRMLAFGNAPTGAYYPTGVERSDGIRRAASGD
jgi:hypothetical protein